MDEKKLKALRLALDIAEAGGVYISVSAADMRLVLDEIVNLHLVLKAVAEEIEDAQLIDLNYGEAKGVRADLLEPIRRYLENVQ